MKKILAIFLTLAILVGIAPLRSYASDDESQEGSVSASAPEIKAEAALLMEASTGRVLYAKNELKGASPASVTKIMTLLLVAEALDYGAYSLTDKVSVSAYAASMGGSQVFLEEGEELTVEELIKCTVIASANDAAVALAELTAGSEEAFVARMNQRAKELGLVNTAFENTTGLDDTTTNHYSCALDIAVMSRELIKHEIILRYSSVWQDTIRDGEFTLTNTNRLVRYYRGCNGLKTGSTAKAGYCVSTTAKRGEMQLIAVIMGAESRDERNDAARCLLDYGFAEYSLINFPAEYLEDAAVKGGEKSTVPLYVKEFTILTEKKNASSIEREYQLPESVNAPIAKDQTVGKVIYKIGGVNIGECDVIVGEEVRSIDFVVLYLRILKRMCAGE